MKPIARRGASTRLAIIPYTNMWCMSTFDASGSFSDNPLCVMTQTTHGIARPVTRLAPSATKLTRP